MIQLSSSVTQVLARLFPWILVKFVINLYLRLWIGSSVPSVLIYNTLAIKIFFFFLAKLQCLCIKKEERIGREVCLTSSDQDQWQTVQEKTTGHRGLNCKLGSFMSCHVAIKVFILQSLKNIENEFLLVYYRISNVIIRCADLFLCKSQVSQYRIGRTDNIYKIYIPY